MYVNVLWICEFCDFYNFLNVFFFLCKKRNELYTRKKPLFFVPLDKKKSMRLCVCHSDGVTTKLGLFNLLYADELS